MLFSMEFSGCVNDDSIGPSVQGCRGDFDFTLKFEMLFLAIIPAVIFVAVALPRLIVLMRKPVTVGGAMFQGVKLAALAVYSVVQLALLILSAVKAEHLADYFIGSGVMNLVSALFMCALSFLEHSRSPRPSILINGYLALTILFDIARTRSMWLSAASSDEISFIRLFTASVVLKALLIVLESRHKTRWLHWDAKAHSPEESSGLYNLGALFWLNSLFMRGYRSILTVPDLFPLDEHIGATGLQERFNKEMEATSGKDALAKALSKTLAVPLLLPIAPRIALTGFNFCQPFLIQTLLNHLQAPQTDDTNNAGYGLIGATVLIYIGIALTTTFYWYFQERAMWMARGCLAAAVYKKTTESRLSAADDSAALTLMSADVERIRIGFLFIHEFWANTVEVALASWLLQSQLGAAFVAPLIVVLFCILASVFTSKFAGPRQKAWMGKIQKRVGLTANVIGNMKHLKISGLTGPVEEAIQEMRVDELKTGGRFRMILIFAATISFVPRTIAPVFTFAVTSTTLDVTTMFTSMSYLLLLSTPLMILFQAAPQLLAGLICLRRIQSFLQKPSRNDFRQGRLEMVSEKTEAEEEKTVGPAIQVINGNFGWEDDVYNLKDIDITIPSSKLTLVVGPVASGKTTLSKALLGETPVFNGQVKAAVSFRKVGYCDQVPFLWNATIRENIIGFSPMNEQRYDEVLEASLLKPDILLFPSGDRTKVGSNGITLSGGQKQRVSIARALYADSELLIFDDILSGLDADTEEQVFWRTFGPDGLLKKRGATVVLCTHSIRHLPSADHIVALGAEGVLVEEGTFKDLVANKKYVHSLGVTEHSRPESGAATPVESDKVVSLARLETIKSVATDHVNDMARQQGDSTVYRHYFASIGLFWITTFCVICAICGFFYNWQTIWIKIWSEDLVSASPHHSNAFYNGMHAFFQFTAILSFYVAVLLGFGPLILLSGARLHKTALRTMIAAPLRFFTITDTGVVTNLFSQDMTLIDGELPNSIANFALDGFISIGTIVIIAVSAPWLTISFPFIGALLWIIQKFYLRTSRQLRLLDLEAKSPLYTHFLDTIKGVATFRAFGWVPDGIELNNQLLDTSQRPAYLLAMIQRWLNFVMNMVIAVIAIGIVALATQLRTGSGFTGSSLLSLMSFGEILGAIIKMYTMLETSIGAVSRLKSFSDNTAPEDRPGEDVMPDESWPLRGQIEIRDVSASYGIDATVSVDEKNRPGSPTNLALRHLSLTIQPGEKVAICGRSGSGKSSTILLLLRLLDPLDSCDDNITIDGISLKTLDRSTLRRRIIAVPQDAVFLPDGTSFKVNMDPFNITTDAECQAVLETVGLWAFVEARGGLASGMTADTLSQGQKQLFSLGRAILRKRIRARDLAAAAAGSSGDESAGASYEKSAAAAGASAVRGGILLLDEVSSSVDVDTDRAMQQMIKEEFAGYTIVMVSHRLGLVMDFDKVVVMDSGSVVETGNPKELVETDGSRFRDLWLVSNHE